MWLPRFGILALLLAGFSGLAGGLWMLMFSGYDPDAAKTWDDRELACIEDPACDLRKHDRLRDRAESEEHAQGAAGAPLVATGLILLGSGMAWAMARESRA